MSELQVWIKSATQLANMDTGINNKSDPYVRVFLDEKEIMKTKVIKNNLNPVWNERSGLKLSSKRNALIFRVFDKDRFTRDDLIGEVSVNLDDLYNVKTLDRSLVLTDKGRNRGYLHVSLKLT